jgi:hypothetical protein
MAKTLMKTIFLNALENPKFVFTGRTEVRVGGLKDHI